MGVTRLTGWRGWQGWRWMWFVRQLRWSLECNEAKRPVYGSEGVDGGGCRGSQGVKRASRGSHGAIVSTQRILGDWELLFQYRPPPLHAGEENVIQNSPLSILNNTQRLAEDMRDQVLDLGLKYSQTRSLLIRWKKLHWCPESLPSLFFK